MLKSVTCGPAGTVLSWLSMTWPSWNVHFAVRSPPLPSVATEAWMVSLVANEVAGVVTRLSAPTALPRSTVVTATLAAGGGGVAAGIGAGSAAGGGVVAVASVVSCFLQPARAMPATSAAVMAVPRNVRFMGNLRGGWVTAWEA